MQNITNVMMEKYSVLCFPILIFSFVTLPNIIVKTWPNLSRFTINFKLDSSQEIDKATEAPQHCSRVTLAVCLMLKDHTLFKLRLLHRNELSKYSSFHLRLLQTC